MMYRKFIAVVLASAVAVTGLTASPARANDNELLQILGGIAAREILGSAIADYERQSRIDRNRRHDDRALPGRRVGHRIDDDDRRRHGHKKHKHKHKHKHGKKDRQFDRHKWHDHDSKRHHGHLRDGWPRNGYVGNEDRYGHQHGSRGLIRDPKPLPDRVRRKVLPLACQVQARNRHGNFTAYTRFCLKNRYQYAASLPQRCITRAQIYPNSRLYNVYTNVCLRNNGYLAAPY